MKRRFDQSYSKVYDDETGEYLHSYAECGIDRTMPVKKMNELVDERENYLSFTAEEEDLEKQD